MGHFSSLLLLPWYYYIFLLYSLFFRGSVSLALLLFLFVFLLFLFCSLSLIYFLFQWIFCASASKTSKGVLQSFYYQKIKGNGEFVQGGSNHKKKEGMNNNKADRPGFTASPDKSNTDHAVFQMSIWKMSGWERGWPEKMGCSQEWNGMGWENLQCYRVME